MVTDSYIKNENKTVCVTLAIAKKHLKLSASSTSEDDLIQGYVDAATADIQNYINRSINSREFVLEASQFETLPFSVNNDNDAVAKIEYYAPGETVVTALDVAGYKLRPGDVVGTKSIKFIDAPVTEKRDNAVIITINQGYTAEDLPTPLKQAILLLIGDMYERREDRGEIGYNRAAYALARPYRKY